MKLFSKIVLAVLGTMFFFTACNKVDDLPVYGAGTTPTLSVSTTTVAPAPADSLNKVIGFSWTDPKHAQDPSLYKFILQFDVQGGDFSHAAERTVTGTLTDSITAKELNNILLGFGFTFNVPGNIDVRLISSYSNNNEQLFSNTITINATPYKIPPKIELPASGTLFLVGNATAGGWSNPVPVPTQEFSRVDETTWVGVFDLSGGNQFLILPVNGDWSHKYSVANGSLPGLNNGGDFGYDLPDNFPGPSSSGWYKIVVDFQLGKFTVTPYNGPLLPTDLFMVGDATAGGWNNPVPVPSQQFTRVNSVQFELTVALEGNKQYLFLPTNGSWDHKYAVGDPTVAGLASGGFFGYDLSSNFPGPAEAGNYKIEVNFGVDDPQTSGDNEAWFKVTKL